MTSTAVLERTPLLDQATEFRRAAAERVPGRVAELVERRVRILLGLDDASTDPDTAELAPAESAVIDIVEQFMIDVHGITDARFAALGEHYTNEEQVAIMFHLALVDGFAKLDKAAGRQDDTSERTTTSAKEQS